MIQNLQPTSLALALLLCGCSTPAANQTTPPEETGTSVVKQAPTTAQPIASNPPAASDNPVDPRSPRKVAGAWKITRGAGYEGAIVSTDRAWSFGMTQAGGAKIDGSFMPEEAAVRRAEAGLKAELEKAKEGKAIAPKLAKYKRQYVGLSAGARKLIYINAFCDAPPGWQSSPVSVDDGGDCYFQIVFDTETGAYSDLSVNGTG